MSTEEIAYAAIIGDPDAPTQSEMIEWFLRDNPGPHTYLEVQKATGIQNMKIVIVLLGQLAKKGEIEKTEDKRYRKVA